MEAAKRELPSIVKGIKPVQPRLSKVPAMIELCYEAEVEVEQQINDDNWEPVFTECGDPIMQTVVETREERANILSAGNIALLSALPGKGKTSIVEAICASSAPPVYQDIDTLGFATDRMGRKILRFDTEMTHPDLETSHWRMCRRIGLPPEASGLHHLSVWGMKGKSISERLKALQHAINSEEYGIIIVDQMADLLPSVNDENIVNQLLDELIGACERHSVGLFCTSHLNENMASIKSRGHLGSHLERKASWVGIINYDRETRIYNIETKKARSASRDAIAAYKWNRSKGFFTSCAPHNKKYRAN
jgi:hypothetical protein